MCGKEVMSFCDCNCRRPWTGSINSLEEACLLQNSTLPSLNTWRHRCPWPQLTCLPAPDVTSLKGRCGLAETDSLPATL